MANQLQTATLSAILTLRGRGWSFRLIGREPGIHRDTVARYVRLAEAKPAKPHTGWAGPNLPTESADQDRPDPPAGLVLVGGYRVSRREFLVAEDPHTLVDAGMVAKACAEWPSREFALITFPATEAVRYYAHLWGLPRPAHPIDGRVRATYVVVNHTQSLEDVLAAKGGSWVRAYGPPRLYKTLPHCRIYRMDQIAVAGQLAGVIKPPNP